MQELMRKRRTNSIKDTTLVMYMLAKSDSCCMVRERHRLLKVTNYNDRSTTFNGMCVRLVKTLRTVLRSRASDVGMHMSWSLREVLFVICKNYPS